MRTPFDQFASGPVDGATDDRFADSPQSETPRPDMEAERKYPNGAPTYTSATAVPGDLPWAGAADPSIAAGFTTEGVRHVRLLVDINRASASGWEKAAQSVDEPSLKARFAEIARQRMGFAEELQTLVHAETAASDGPSLSGAVRRWWGALGSGTGEARTRAVLEEAERDEDKVLGAYKAAMREGSLSGIVRVIGDQTVRVQRVHDEVRALRDRSRTA